MTTVRMKDKRLERGRAIQVLAALVLILGIGMAFGPFAQAAETISVDGTCTDANTDGECDGTPGTYKTIQAAVTAAGLGDTINVAAGTYVISSEINLNKANLTLSGAGSASSIIQVSGTGYRLKITAAGVSIDGFGIQKTDKTAQNIIYIGASNVSITNNEISGQFVIGDGEVSRAMEVPGGLTGLNITGNTIYDLRQPGYFNGPTTTGTISDNYVYRTKGWVLDGGDMTFSNNTWGTGADSNVFDIAILAGVGAAYYPDIVAMANANNGAFIEDQRTSPATLSIVHVDGSVASSGDGTARSPKKTIAEGAVRAAPGGTVNVAAGTYNEILDLTKAVTLRGANAGIHPAVGTHSTETVGTRGAETILSHNYPAIRPKADNITVDGFKFTGAGGRIIDTYVDANNFHLTNSIFDNPAVATSTGVIQFGGGSHTDMLIDFNLFQDKGDHTLYTGGGPFDGLQIAYNKFSVAGNSVFWTATPLADGVIEGNEFDGTIGGTPGVGDGTINIGQGGNIAVRDNHFHDMLYTPIQIGIINGSVTGNLFERIYPLSGYWASALELWGGQYGTAVSSNVTIEDNTIHYNDVPGAAEPTHGLRLRAPDSGAGIDGATIHLTNNAFVDGGVRSDAFAIRHQGNPATAVDAPSNWWGTNAPTASLFQGNVNYVPWCTDAACTTFGAPVTNVTQGTYFATIQAAIDAATTTTGDEINVAAGTYVEEIDLNKQVTIQGANSAVAAGANPGTRAAETIIDGGFIVSASGAKIDGVTIQNGRSSGGIKVGVAVAASNVTVEDTIIEDVAAPAQSDGISTQPGNNSLSVINSTIRNNWRGIYFNPGDGHVLTGNLIESNNGVGVGIGSDGLSNTTLTGNTFTGNNLEGWGASAVGTNVSAHFNVFDGGTNGIYHYGGNEIDAINNWWGDASGPTHASNSGGTGATVTNNVAFDPWLGAETSETNTDAPAANGGTVSLPSNEVSVKNTGPAGMVVTIAKYTSNPSSVGSFGSGGSYYDVNVSGSGAGDSLEVTISTGGSTGNLYYYDGAAWRPVVAYSGSPAALGSVAPSTSNVGFYVFELNNVDTKPLLSELTGTAFTGANAEIRLIAIPTTLADGETVAVEVEATSLGLYGVDVSLAFNTANLEVANVVLGGDLAADVVAVNETGAGTLRFAFSQKADVHPNEVSGNSTTPILLATVVFRSTAAGTAPSYEVDPAIYLTSALFSDINGNDTAPGLLDDSGNPVVLTINPSPRAYVDIALQGRGATVAANSGATLELKPTGTGSVLYSTAVGPQLEIETAPAGTYDVRVSAPKYLAAIQTVTIDADAVEWDLNGTVKDLASGVTLTLRGGDINGDDKINIQDLVLIGVNFGSTDQSNLANINDDTTGVNIQDLSIAAGNYGSFTTGSNSYIAPWTH